MAIAKADRARVVIEADTSKLGQGLAVAEKRLRSFGSGIGKMFKSGALNIGKSLMNGFGMAGGMSIAGGFEEAFDASKQFEASLVRMQIAGDLTSSGLADMRSEMIRVAEDQGFSRNQVLAAAKAYQELTGDTQGAMQSARTFARVANATGSDLTEVAQAAASLGDTFKIASTDMEAAFSILAVGGKAGKVEIKDFAAEIARMAGAFAGFKNSQSLSGLASMSAAYQVINKDVGNATEATTRMNSLLAQIKKNSVQLERVGVKVFDRNPKTGVKQLREFSAIIDDITQSKLAKDEPMLMKVMGERNASGAISTLIREKQLMTDIVAKSKDRNAIERDSAAWQNSAPGKIQKSFAALKESFADAFTPERIKAFADAMAKVASLLSDIVAGISNIVSKYSGYVNRNKESIGSAVWGTTFRIFGADYDAYKEARDLAEANSPDFEDIAAKMMAPFRSVGLKPRLSLNPPRQSSNATPPISVNIDGNAVAKSVSNARDARRGLAR